MTTSGGFSWGAFFAGAAALLILLIVIAAIVIFGGLYPVAASKPDPAGVGWILNTTRDHAIEKSAGGLTSPNFSEADIREGGSHFKGMCERCHGGPGAKPDDFATAMNPDPPDLGKSTGDLSVAQVFWIARNGLKMTAMPAFGQNHSDEELWKIAAFVKQLPKVTPQQYAAIPNAHAGGGH